MTKLPKLSQYFLYQHLFELYSDSVQFFDYPVGLQVGELLFLVILVNELQNLIVEKEEVFDPDSLVNVDKLHRK